MNDQSVHDDLMMVAANYAWSWNPVWSALLDEATGWRHRDVTHPIEALMDMTADDRMSLDAFADRARLAAAEVAALEAGTADDAQPDVAYFSPEFGVSDALPQYSGGLGILAGDHLKAASDLEVSLVGVGLFYANGYFSQDVDADGQTVAYNLYQPERLGLTDTGHQIEVTTPRGPVAARVWLANIGRVRLYLLDTRVDANPEWAANICDRLYGGDQQHRIDQEWLLGIGGHRALQAVGVDPQVIHLNEGHAGFCLLESLRLRMAAGDGFDQARGWVRDRTLFTTHTPVPAGIDRFPRSLLEPYLDVWAAEVSAGIGSEGTRGAGDMDVGLVWKLGELPSDNAPDEFNMAAFCLRHAATTNGVSTLHGEVSRSLFASVTEGAEITSVTNGVHARTWTTPTVQSFLDTHLAPGWDQGRPESWEQAATIPTADIVAMRAQGRADLIEVLARRGFAGLDPEALTIGFARRFATYKRAALLLEEQARLEALLADTDRPIQFIFAGKAHPADLPGQALLAEVVGFGRSAGAKGRFIFVPGYDIAIASALYGGCDVWLNNPVRPQEACGTSGEKSALNGGLNCSILDGWWAEWYDQANGWAIPTSDHTDARRRDAEEADGLLSLFEDEIVPQFYADGVVRPSEAWVSRIRAGWTYLGPKVTAGRMVAEYDDRLYRQLPARLVGS